LWLVKLVESIFGLELAVYGVYPRDPMGAWGILFAPLIHGSFSHLFANTGPLLIIGTLLLYGYPRSARILIPVLYLGSGLGVWLLARDAFHIGASGLIFGMMFFVFTIGILRWDRSAIALSLVVFFLYGGMVWGVFPGDPGVSFESHIFGAVIGIALAFLLKNRDPAPARKKYSWEGADEDNDEEIW
jgi:membrane associated rhomboid family serine protease